jgi:hypothetical protein
MPSTGGSEFSPRDPKKAHEIRSKWPGDFGSRSSGSIMCLVFACAVPRWVWRCFRVGKPQENVVADITHNIANKTTETPSFSKDWPYRIRYCERLVRRDNSQYTY